MNTPRDLKRLADIMLNKLETLITLTRNNILRSPRDEIVYAQHPEAFADKTLAEMRTNEPRPAGNENCLFFHLAITFLS